VASCSGGALGIESTPNGSRARARDAIRASLKSFKSKAPNLGGQRKPKRGRRRGGGPPAAGGSGRNPEINFRGSGVISASYNDISLTALPGPCRARGQTPASRETAEPAFFNTLLEVSQAESGPDQLQ
jgi:hypothetical protein